MGASRVSRHVTPWAHPARGTSKAPVQLSKSVAVANCPPIADGSASTVPMSCKLSGAAFITSDKSGSIPALSKTCTVHAVSPTATAPAKSGKLSMAGPCIGVVFWPSTTASSAMLSPRSIPNEFLTSKTKRGALRKNSAGSQLFSSGMAIRASMGCDNSEENLPKAPVTATSSNVVWMDSTSSGSTD